MTSLVGHDGNYCCFALTRGFESFDAATSENARGLRHRYVSLLKKENKVDATGGITTGGGTTYSLEWAARGTLRPCATFWCAASACSMGTDTQRRVQRKRTHRGTGRSLSTRKWAVVKEARIPDSDEKNLSHDGLRRTRSFGISVSTTGRETTSNCSKKKKHSPFSAHIRPCCRTAKKISSSTAEMTSSATICS